MTRRPCHGQNNGANGLFDKPTALRDHLSMRRVLICLVLAGCAPDPSAIEMADRKIVQTAEEIAFVMRLFNDIQPTSIAEGREYCGVIGIDDAGRLVATVPRRGNVASCLPPSPNRSDMDVFASYHTHGSWDVDYFNEIPSFDDMRTDIQDGTDGYVATPSGRLWYVDAHARKTRQLCGSHCLVSDPNHIDDPTIVVQQSYTLDELRAF